MFECRICKRNPDIQELRTTIASPRSDDRLTVTVRRPNTILFRIGTVFVDAANVINPDIERHIIKSAKDRQKKVFQPGENLPHLIKNKGKWGCKTITDPCAGGIRD